MQRASERERKILILDFFGCGMTQEQEGEYFWIASGGKNRRFTL